VHVGPGVGRAPGPTLSPESDGPGVYCIEPPPAGPF